jgi:hypothetical protein
MSLHSFDLEQKCHDMQSRRRVWPVNTLVFVLCLIVCSIDWTGFVMYRHFYPKVREVVEPRQYPPPKRFSHCLDLGLKTDDDVWITGAVNWGRYVTSQFGYTISSAIEQHAFIPVGFAQIQAAVGKNESKHALAAMSPTNRSPAVVLVWEAYDPEVVMWLKQSVPVFFFADDLHYHSDEQRQKKQLVFENVDLLFNTYAYNFLRFYPALASLPVKWMPHAIAPYFLFDNINDRASPTAALSGAISSVYPLRQMAKRFSQKHNRIIVVPHPGYRVINDTSLVREKYAEVLRSHRAAITCGSIYQYVVAKTLEIPATGSLLIVDRSLIPHLSELGMQLNTHLLSFHDEHSLRESLDIALSAEKHAQQVADRMRTAGQRLVLGRHSTFTRASELAAEVRLWAGAWHARRNDNAINRGCWDAFVKDATTPFLEPGSQQDPSPPARLRFRQVRLLSMQHKHT